MNLPHQAVPVPRHVSETKFEAGRVTASNGIACQLCMAACDQLSGMSRTLCQLAYQHTVC